MNTINYELFAKQVQRKAFELIKQRNLSCNAIGVGIDEHPEKGTVFLLSLDIDGVENGVLPFLMYQVIEKGVDAFAEDIADIVQELGQKVRGKRKMIIRFIFSGFEVVTEARSEKAAKAILKAKGFIFPKNNNYTVEKEEI